jgi:uncharacterized protein YbjT (DUF2867 family)
MAILPAGWARKIPEKFDCAPLVPRIGCVLRHNTGGTGRTVHRDYDVESPESHDWKRRAERLVRASGCPYMIVRPGWFDYNKPDEHHLLFLQGDPRQTGNSSDGVIARRQIAEVLVSRLTSDEALRKTFELVATKGPAQKDLKTLFAELDPDPDGSVDGVRDLPNQPLKDELKHVQDDLCALSESNRKSWPAGEGMQTR